MKTLFVISISVLFLTPYNIFCQSKFDSLILGYWVQTDQKHYQDEYIPSDIFPTYPDSKGDSTIVILHVLVGKFNATYGDTTVYVEGLNFANGSVKFMFGIESSPLILRQDHPEEDTYPNELKKEKLQRIDYKATKYVIKDSLLYVRIPGDNYYIHLCIKTLTSDSLYLYNPQLEYTEGFVKKRYDTLPQININKIVYKQNVALFGGKEYTIEIDSNRNFRYHGEIGVDYEGKYKGIIDLPYYKDIAEKVILADITHLKDDYSIFMTDAGSETITIYYEKNSEKEIYMYASAGPTELRWLTKCFKDFEHKVYLQELDK